MADSFPDDMGFSFHYEGWEENNRLSALGSDFQVNG
jgi:hypothetical protein